MDKEWTPDKGVLIGDRWDRTTNFNCDSCRYYVPKPNYGTNLGACRRRAPIMTGYPVVNQELDWCGEHKIGSNPVRDGKSKVTAEQMADSLWNKPIPMLCVQHGGSPSCEQINAVNKLTCPMCQEDLSFYHYCPDCHRSWGIKPSGTNLPGESASVLKTCPECSKKPQTRCEHEWIDADNEVVSGAEICRKCHNIRSKMGEGIKIQSKAGKICLKTEEGTTLKKETLGIVLPLDPEEKAKIKRDIRQQCEFLLIVAGIGDSTERDKDAKLYTEEIKQLLEKL